MAFRRILVAVDGSEGSLIAVGVALRLAHAIEAPIILLQVVEEEGPLPTVSDDPPPGVDRVEFLADRRFEPITHAFGDASDSWTRRVEVGFAAEEICRVAKEAEADLIVMGSRGLSPTKRLLLGSVSDKVVRDAPCSVLIAR